jgi:predicted dinucleotide-utilizing enzyme
MIEYFIVLGGAAVVVLFLRFRPKLRAWLKARDLDSDIDTGLLLMEEVVESTADQAITDGNVVELENARKALFLLRASLLDEEMSPEARAELRKAARAAVKGLVDATKCKQ